MEFGVWSLECGVYDVALGLLADELKQNVRSLGVEPEEIRLRVGRAVTVCSCGREISAGGRAVTEGDLRRVLEVATNASLHRAIGDLRNGFVTYKGLRIGVCGSAVMNGESVVGFSAYRSLNIRIPARFSGEIGELLQRLDRKPFENTLIVSPPGGGKTTLLRELIHSLSSAGHRIAVVDDRNELFAAEADSCGFDPGEHTDVLGGMDKARGAMLLLRSMSPEIIALDEITCQADAEAVLEIFGCGVGILATAHGSNISKMRGREMYKKLLEEGIFQHILSVNIIDGARIYTLEE